MRLTHIHQLTARLELVSGLHIGAGDSEMHIGGTDNPVVKHPHTGEPYIPGSSLKGKLRSLLEWKSGAVRARPLGFTDWQAAREESRDAVRTVLQLFGVGGGDQLTESQALELGPTRLAFWDLSMSREWVQQMQEANLLYTESKSENMINRISGVAEHPRNTERVPAGASFEFRLSLKKFEDDGEELLDAVFAALKLLELDSLGGSGSRGYGKVRLTGLALDGEDIQPRFDAIRPFA